MKYLCIEFSNLLVDEDRELMDIQNRELFYAIKRKDGFIKTTHFTEFPQWCNHIAGIINSENVQLHICINIQETIDYISEIEPEYVFFSSLISTEKYIKEIITNSNNNNIKFIVGRAIGTGNNIKSSKNIVVINDLLQLNKYFNFDKEYKLIKLVGDNERNYITRIYTTKGCNNNCKFCEKEKGKVKLLSYNRVDNYNSLCNFSKSYPLVYIGNKTFGQYDYTEEVLPHVDNIRYIVQSSVDTIYDNLHTLKDWYYDKGIHYIELGIESFSENTLNNIGKNYKLEQIEPVIKTLVSIGIKPIINIMLGILGDTAVDYNKTIEGIKKYASVLYNINITNYSDYSSKNINDRDERILMKSWITNKSALSKFAKEVYRLNTIILINNYEQIN